VGEDGKGLYFIDKELAELAKGAPASIMDGNA
jgi:ferritin